MSSNYHARSPILFLVFNRPEKTRQVFETIRQVRPRRLYVAADGPRKNKSEEVQICEEVRKIATSVDWDCEIKTLFREQNKGCALAVSEAITWFFDCETEGIILEDDCLPDISFFRFMDELLEYYREDQSVGIISGNNFCESASRGLYSYSFSIFPLIWGWASWRRAWAYYDHTMTIWPEVRDEGWLLDILGSKNALPYWIEAFEGTYLGNIDSWGYRWTLSCWRQGLMSIVPKVNLVRNIGFGPEATHTKGNKKNHPASVSRSLDFPLKHPRHRIINRRLDKCLLKRHFKLSLKRRVKYRLRNYLF